MGCNRAQFGCLHLPPSQARGVQIIPSGLAPEERPNRAFLLILAGGVQALVLRLARSVRGEMARKP
jgi:hypothetical protein